MYISKKQKPRKIVFFLASILITVYFNANAQNESSKWIFGQGAGIDFKSGEAKPILSSKINTIEGCSTISDSNGDLLFYTDGISVWNKNNKQMPNGKNLNGNTSSTQSATIVPLPESKTIYYIFTMDSEAEKGGFSYSIVDMAKENGLGDIILKNKLINTSFTEKLVAVKKPDTNNFWIIAHAYDSNAFSAYLLTKNGLTVQPVISNVGLRHEKSFFNTIGYMKVSPDKRKLALAINGDKIIQLFNFDATKGIITNPISIKLNEQSNPYGLEFSPNSNLLYISTVLSGFIFQVNITTGSEDAIQKSLQLVGRSKSKKSLGALQLGPDGRIYIAEYDSKFLSTIDKPDMIGLDCSYRAEAVSLGGNICKLGLPTFVQDFIGKPNLTTDTQAAEKEDFSKTNIRYSLSNVCFNFNKATLQDSYNPVLEQLAHFLNKNKKLNIQIVGHTDSIGNVQHNYKLSLERAKTIGKYLIDHGIEKSRITFSGEGSNAPLSSNKDESGRKKNRRVEFILKK